MKKSHINNLFCVVATVVLMSVCNVAHSVIIQFDPLSGAEGSTYLGHTESGFTVTPTMGDLHEAHGIGNIVPSIYGGPLLTPIPAAIDVTRSDSGIFTFAGVQLRSGHNAGTNYLVEGFLNSVPVLNFSGIVGQADQFLTIQSLDPFQILDLLTLTVTPTSGVRSFNIDNIGVNAVPIPPALWLFGSGLLGMIGVARHKKAA